MERVFEHILSTLTAHTVSELQRPLQLPAGVQFSDAVQSLDEYQSQVQKTAQSEVPALLLAFSQSFQQQLVSRTVVWAEKYADEDNAKRDAKRKPESKQQKDEKDGKGMRLAPSCFATFD
jgi:hypothetical protein